jgi:predicted secreted protein with PEFG-CTERM motif
VNTDKTNYATGDTITVTGNVGTVTPGQPVLYRVLDRQDKVYQFGEVPVAADGSYSFSFAVGGDLGADGQYRVAVTYAGKSAETTFNVGASELTEGFQTATLVIDDETYEIQYRIIGGTLDDLSGDAESATITAEIAAEGDGQLVIRMPREVADARGGDGEDTDYVVILDDVGEEEIPDDDYDDRVRTLTIDFNADTTSIEILGTFVAPEFGTIAALILAVAIVGMILATTRRSHFMPTL